MDRALPRRRLIVTAFHEAGHAVACCRYKHGFHCVHVGVGAPIIDRRGRSIKALGLCEGGYFNEHLFWPHVSAIQWVSQDGQQHDRSALVRENGYRCMVLTLAGPFAEARRRRCSLLSVYLTGGGGDFDEAENIARFLASGSADEMKLIQAAEAEAKRCVSQHWEAITELANTLIERGSVDFGDAPAVVRTMQYLEGRIAPE